MNLSFKEFINSKPNLKYLFFGGKGGVGKTVIAAGTAYYLAESLGKKTLISSTNPVHSLSSAFGQDIWGKGIQKIKDTKNLYAIEIDISDTIKRYKEEIRNKILTFLK
ncbi:MAG: ArsA-related P-loop ATPase, partial [Nitrososphaerota archaeon]